MALGSCYSYKIVDVAKASLVVALRSRLSHPCRHGLLVETTLACLLEFPCQDAVDAFPLLLAKNILLTLHAQIDSYL